MPNLTLSVPEEVSKQMKHFSEVRWSEVARKAIVEKLELLKMAEKIANKSKLTLDDVNEFSNKIKSSATKKFLT